MTISTDRLLDIAERLDQLRHQLCDEAEKLIPVSSPVKTADNPIVLPTVKEVRTAIIMAEHDGGWIEHTVARAVLDLIASRVPVWQPVEPGTIRPGMRVRYVATGGIEGIFTVEDVADGRFYFKSGYAWSGMSDHAWFVDPRTVPAEPEDPRVAVVREWRASFRWIRTPETKASPATCSPASTPRGPNSERLLEGCPPGRHRLLQRQSPLAAACW